ncbi:MAG TPA: DUF4058 family protein, partial [Aggregatilineales bacterium]|nr:DUF4058 family protein [Aggregatilineales bacterium]
MPIYAPENLYPGINPHLNSFLQHEPGAWESFHAELVIQTRIILDSQLPPGYLALAEKSLQISEMASVAFNAVPGKGARLCALTVSGILTSDEQLKGVVIYQAGEGSTFGRPITRIEVISPANKPGGSHYPRYVEKRLETLRSGLRLVEIDYLPESGSLMHSLPSYPGQDDDAYPYVIIVSDPRPEFEKGRVKVYGFGVQ